MASFRVKIGFPDVWTDYGPLEIGATDPWCAHPGTSSLVTIGDNHRAELPGCSWARDWGPRKLTPAPACLLLRRLPQADHGAGGAALRAPPRHGAHRRRGGPRAVAHAAADGQRVLPPDAQRDRLPCGDPPGPPLFSALGWRSGFVRVFYVLCSCARAFVWSCGPPPRRHGRTPPPDGAAPAANRTGDPSPRSRRSSTGAPTTRSTSARWAPWSGTR